MSNILLNQLVQEAEKAVEDAEAINRKARNKKKADRQARRPQGRGRERKGSLKK